MPAGNKERHRTGRIGWLRAAVLGANDGIISVASLLTGVTQTQVSSRQMLQIGIAVRLNILTRKTLGGIETDLDSRAIGADGQPVPGLYAVGEAAGFGGGGVHGYRALEGTFLGGCIFSGRAADWCCRVCLRILTQNFLSRSIG